MDYGRSTEPSVGWQRGVGADTYGSARTHDDEWERLIDADSGAAYWFNNQTGESVWVEENEASGTDGTLRTGMHEATYASFTGEASPTQGGRENPDEVMVDTSSLEYGGDAVEDALSEAKRRKLAAEQELEMLRNAAAAAAEAEDRTVAMVKKDLEESRARRGGGAGATVSPELAEYIQSPTEKKLDELKRRQQHEVEEDEDFTYVSNSPGTQNLDEVFAKAHAEARALIDKVRQDDDNRVTHVTKDVNKALDHIDKVLHREQIVDENMKAFNANRHEPSVPKEAPGVNDIAIEEETELQTLIDASRREEERLAKAGRTIVETEEIPIDPESETEAVVVEAVDIGESGDKESIDLPAFTESDAKAVVAEAVDVVESDDGWPDGDGIGTKTEEISDRATRPNTGDDVTNDRVSYLSPTLLSRGQVGKNPDADLDSPAKEDNPILSRPTSRADTAEVVRKTAYALDFVESHLQTLGQNVIEQVHTKGDPKTVAQRVAAQQAHVAQMVQKNRSPGGPSKSDTTHHTRSRQRPVESPPVKRRPPAESPKSTRPLPPPLPTQPERRPPSVETPVRQAPPNHPPDVHRRHERGPGNAAGSSTHRSQVSNVSTLSTKRMQPLREAIVEAKEDNGGTISDINERTIFAVGNLPLSMTDVQCKRYIEAFGQIAFFKRVDESKTKRKFIVKFISVDESKIAFMYLLTATIGLATVKIQMINDLVVQALLGDMLEKTAAGAPGSPKKRTDGASPPLRRAAPSPPTVSTEDKMAAVMSKRKRLEQEKQAELEEKAKRREEQHLRYEAERKEKLRVMKEERMLRERHRRELTAVKKKLEKFSPKKTKSWTSSPQNKKKSTSAAAVLLEERLQEPPTHGEEEWTPLTPSNWPNKQSPQTGNALRKTPTTGTSVSEARHTIVSPSKLSSLLFSPKNAQSVGPNISYVDPEKSKARLHRREKKKKRKAKQKGSENAKNVSPFGKASLRPVLVSQTSKHLYKPYVADERVYKTENRKHLREARKYQALVSSTTQLLNRVDERKAPIQKLYPQRHDETSATEGTMIPDWSPSHERTGVGREDAQVANAVDRSNKRLNAEQRRIRYKAEYGRVHPRKKPNKMTKFTSLPSLSLYQNYKKLWSQSLRGSVSPVAKRKKSKRAKDAYGAYDAPPPQRGAGNRSAWDNRLLQGRDKGPGKGPGKGPNKGPGWRKTPTRGLRTPGISSQKYTLRDGEQLSSHPSGEVWDEELQMFYRKRYND